MTLDLEKLKEIAGKAERHPHNLTLDDIALSALEGSPLSDQGGDRRVSDNPIIFSGPMVCALLGGRKTQTRRILKLRRGVMLGEEEWPWPLEAMETPRYAIGDRLWVRESLKAHNLDLGGALGLTEPLTALDMSRDDVCASYAADDEPCVDRHSFDLAWTWERRSIPAIHMPRTFSRLTLTVTAVKVERLQEISEADAEAEGVEPVLVPPDGGSAPHVEGFRAIWESIHGRDAWDTNPLVAAISFTVEKRNIDA